MPPQSDSDLQTELEGLRRRIGILEAKLENRPSRASRPRRPGFSRNFLLGALPVALLLAAGGLLYGQGAGDAFFIDPRGWIGIGTSAPKATLDVAGKLNVSDGAAVTGSLTTTGNVGVGTASPGATLEVAGDSRFNGAVAINRRSIQNQHLVITPAKGNIPFNVTDPAGSTNWLSVFPGGNVIMNGGNVGVGTTKPEARLDVNGVARAKVFAATGPLRNRMYPDNPRVYQEIFDAKNNNVISKLGNPGYDDSTYNSKLWNDRHIIRFGGNNEADGNGVKVTIPKGYDTLWIRVLGERWNVVHAYFLDGGKEDLGLWTGGWRSLNSYSPDGALTDGHKVEHQWVPIAAGRAGELALIAKSNTDHDFWISGVAFSRNPWAHAVQSAVGYHWRVNGGEATLWGDNWHNWNGDSLSKINPKTNLELKVPALPSGRDKVLYLVEHNNNWNGSMHTGITVNGTNIERFTATYDNPFARHWNSKLYERYLAALIPAALIPANARYLSVRIDMRKQDEGIHFREIGTHDVDVPWAD